MREHRRTHPDVKLDLVEQGTREQIIQLIEHRLDIGFLRGPIDEPTITVETLIEDPLLVVVPDEHKLAYEDQIAPASLAHEPLVMWSRAAAPTTFADVVELCRQHNIQPPIADESPRIQTILALVAAGAGVALLPTSYINLARHGVRFVPLRQPLPHRPLELAWRTANHAPSLAGFLAIARQTAPDYLRDLTRRHPQFGPV